jgi:type II secretory pathway pseudopilin PulG
MLFRTIKKQNGFTLAETVISTGLMGVIIISVLSVFITGFNALKDRRKESEISYFTRGKINETRLLFIKYPDYNYDIANKIYTIISGNITSITSAAPPKVILWEDPPAPVGDIIIKGNKDSYAFTILIEEYGVDPNEFNYEIKKVKVTVSKKDGKEIKMNTLISIGLQ